MRVKLALPTAHLPPQLPPTTSLLGGSVGRIIFPDSIVQPQKSPVSAWGSGTQKPAWASSQSQLCIPSQPCAQ